MTTTLMGRWHQSNLKRVEKRMAKVRARMERLLAKKDAHRLTPAQYTRKKSSLDSRLRRLSARERTLMGAIKMERQRAARSRGTAAR